jgi:hypothetical protein
MQIHGWLRKNSAKKFVYIFIVFVCFAIVLFPTSQALAQSPLNFGGIVGWTFFCTCSYNFLLYIVPNPPTMNGFFSYRFTPQYANYRLPSASTWTLGLYSPGDTCLIWVDAVPPICVPFIQPMGVITPIVGTSLGV